MIKNKNKNNNKNINNNRGNIKLSPNYGSTDENGNDYDSDVIPMPAQKKRRVSQLGYLSPDTFSVQKKNNTKKHKGNTKKKYYKIGTL